MNSHRCASIINPVRRSARPAALALAVVAAAGLSFSAAAQQRDYRSDRDMWWGDQRDQTGAARAPYHESRHTYRRDELWRGEPIHGDDFFEPRTDATGRGYDTDFRDDYRARTQVDTWGQRQRLQDPPYWDTDRYEQARRQQQWGQQPQQQWQDDWRTQQRFQDTGRQQSFDEWSRSQRLQDQRFRQSDPFSSAQFRDSGMTGVGFQPTQRFEPYYGFTPSERTIPGRPIGFQQPTLRYFTQDRTSTGGAFDRWYDGQ